MHTDSSSGLNQLEMIVLCAPCRTSPPIPNTALPMSMSPKRELIPPKEQMSCPMTQNPQVIINTILAPTRSISAPPIRGIRTLGKE